MRGAEGRSGRWAIGGAVLSAALSSACCWLPLALVAIGVGTGSVGAFFEAWRWPLVGLTAVLLGTSFWLVYRRDPQCAAGSSCAPPPARWRRLNRLLLWVATAAALAFAFFPGWAGRLAGAAPEVRSAALGDTAVYRIDGMSCEACTAHVVEALRALPGVARVEVSWDERVARVTFAAGVVADDTAVLAAVDDLGFEARRQ
jgi:copper chaperone CopZ